MKLRLAGVVKDSTVDGPGVRYTIFCQGCDHHCEGCQNPQTWDFNKGYDIEIDDLIEDIEDSSIARKVTFSGGDPLYQKEQFTILAKKLKELGYSIVLYTGFNIEDIINEELLKYVDYVIDGKFDLSKKSYELKFKGSSNQRTINMDKTLKFGNLILENF